MFKKNFFIKKFNRSVISITERIESFFSNLKNFRSLINLKNLKRISKTADKKLFIGVASIIVLLLSYFLMPAFYNKELVKIKLENQILEKYNLEVKFEKVLKYSLFPKPHFYTKNIILAFENERLAKSDFLKINIFKKNFLSLENLKIKDLNFKQTKFEIDHDNFSFFKNLLNSNKSDYAVNFNKSKFFYKDQNDDIIFYVDIKKLNFLYNDDLAQELKTLFKIFNIPFKLNIINNLNDKKTFTNIESHNLRLKINNIFNYDDKNINSLLEVKIINKSKKINYIIDNNSIIFNDDKLDISGNIDLKPFYLTSNIKLEQIDPTKIFKNDTILLNLLNSEILNHENLNVNLNINSNSIKGINYFENIKLKFYFEEGNILIKDSTLNWKNAVTINIGDTQLINENDKIVIVGAFIFSFNDINNFYKHHQVKKIYRKKIEEIRLDFVLDLNEKKFEIDSLKIDGISSKNVANFIADLNSKKKDIFNKIIFKNLIKEFFTKL